MLYHTITRLIISLAVVLTIVSCKDPKPKFGYGDKVIFIFFDKSYIEEQFDLTFMELKKICRSRINKDCIVFQENTRNKSNSNYKHLIKLPLDSSQTSTFEAFILYDCFSECHYYFTDTNNTATAMAIIPRDYRKIIYYDEYPFLRNTKNGFSLPKYEGISVYPAYISAEEANGVLFGDRIYNSIEISTTDDPVLKSLNNQSIKIDFYAKNQKDSSKYLAGLLFVRSH